MLKFSLLLLMMLICAPVFAGSNSDLPKIDYEFGHPNDVAGRIHSVDQFSSEVITEYSFYRIFVMGSGVNSLKTELLGSWEFADRIENLKIGWSPVDYNGIERTREKAKEARKKTGVKYKASEANMPPVDWWHQNVVKLVHQFESGEKYDRVFPEQNKYYDDLGIELILKTAASLGMKIEVEWTDGRFEWRSEVDSNVYVQYTYQIRGTIAPGSKLSSMTLLDPEERLKKSGEKFKKVAYGQRMVSHVNRINSLEGDFAALKKALGFGYMDALMAGKAIPLSQNSANLGEFRETLHYLEISPEIKDGTVRIIKDDLEDFASDIPRVRGIYPERLCENKSVL